MYSIFLLLTLVLSQDIMLMTPNQPEQQQYIHYNANNSYSTNFTIKNALCCTPPTLFTLNNTQSIIVKVDQFQITSFSAKFDGTGVKIVYYNNSTNNAIITYQCEEARYGSGLVKNYLKLSNDETYEFYYWYTCGNVKDATYNFDWSAVFLIIIACVMAYVMARYGRIKSFDIQVKRSRKWIAGCDQDSQEECIQFQGIKVSTWFVLIYLIGVALFYIILLVVGTKNSYAFDLLLCSLFSLVMGTIFIDELLCSLSADYKLQKRIYKLVRVCDLLSVLLTVALLIGYLAGGFTWIMSNILALLTVGSALKLFKVTNLKDGTTIFLADSLYGIIHAIILNYYGINYQQYVLQYANLPLLLELPTLKDSVNTTCSWLSIGNIVLPGLIIGYLYRYDFNRNSKKYTLIGVFGLAIGTGLWLLSQIFASRHQISLPLGIFVFTFIIGGTTIWSIQQGDFNQLWNGHFYDKKILDPKFSINDIDGKLFSETELDPHLFSSLVIKQDAVN